MTYIASVLIYLEAESDWVMKYGSAMLWANSESLELQHDDAVVYCVVCNLLFFGLISRFFIRTQHNLSQYGIGEDLSN